MRTHVRTLCFVAMFLPLATLAGGYSSSHRLDGGVVAVTNSQANSSWAVVAVLVKYDAANNGILAVRRVSEGNTYTLATRDFTGASNLVWVAEAAYVFGFGDVLMIESTATNGVVQVMRKSE